MAVRIRRTTHEVRFELMPLIDVVFLLLTFFIYAMVLMVQAHLLPVQLPTLSSSEQLESTSVLEAVSITLDEDGRLFVDGELIDGPDAAVSSVRTFKQDHPEGRVYVAPSIEGNADRLPIFIDLINQLRGSGIDEFYIVGRPEKQ